MPTNDHPGDAPELRPSVHRIVLTGFMGSGKSTVGPLVAARLGWRFIDVDDTITADTGMPISQFFALHGELAFRRVERETIARLIAEDHLVTALGGGAIEDPQTRSLLLNIPATVLIHLEITLETALARCSGTDHTRPVLADRANLRARYNRRLPLYREAHISLVSDSLTPADVASAVLQAAASGLVS